MDIKIDGPLWIGSVVDVKVDNDASKHLEHVNDAKYWNDETGIIKVDRERWKVAQQFELDCWMTYSRHANDDRTSEHRANFNYYHDVPVALGDVIEVGCGPFTQSLPIILNGRIASSLTLVDPLLNNYLSHPNCQYNGKFGFPVTLVNSALEDFNSEFKFDTLVCINVLEHVIDVEICFSKMLKLLNYGGLMIFHDRYWDSLDINSVYDAGHPIRIKKNVLDNFKSNFNLLFDNDSYFIGTKSSVY